MKHSHIASNGITLHVVELGEGKPVLFCHGFPDTWIGWRRQMEAVAAAGYRAISLDMRGYGASSAPSGSHEYTVLHSVGDLVGLLDALHLDSAVVVGHDFGATVAWNAVLMRPDRFPAVFAISVPFVPRGEKSFLETLQQSGHSDFYMFSRMRPEADELWKDARVSYPANLYWSSAAPDEKDRWTFFNRDLPKYRQAPVTLPAWADPDDVAAAIEDFTRTGFHGALNYYRSIQFSFDLMAPFKGKTIDQPSFFLDGAVGSLSGFSGSSDTDSLKRVLPGLVGQKTLAGVGHWPQLEASAETNEALLGFLQKVM